MVPWPAQAAFAVLAGGGALQLPMLSAPAHIAATSDITFAAGFAPPLLPALAMRTLWSTMCKTPALGKAHHRDQPGVRDQIRLVKHGADR